MTTALAALVLVAALTCPAHMLWRMRRGKPARCPPTGGGADDVRARLARLGEDVARTDAERG